MALKRSENKPKIEPKSIKRWREGEERRGKVRREEGKACKERKGAKGRSAESKGDARWQPRRTRGGSSYLKGGEPLLAPAKNTFWDSGLLGFIYFSMLIVASIVDDMLATL